jgi:NAD-dependent histone deacetylase SIR2
MLQDLSKRKTLLRCYSQNIDGLESKVGFNMDSPPSLLNLCIPLHGSLHFLRCIVCASTHLLQNHHAILAAGHFPLCHLCQQKQDEWAAASLRPRKIGQLHPDIVLYGEDYPHGETVAAACKHDQTLDLLLVVGTSLKVPGIANLIKTFSKQLHNNGLQHSFYINETAPSKEWQNIFDVFVEGDCQTFAKSLRNNLGASSSNQYETNNQGNVVAYLEGLEARQDFRPSWRWI